MSRQVKSFVTPEEYLAIERVLIAQDEYRVEQYVKQTDGHWLLSDIVSLENTVDLQAIGCSLALRDIYDRVVID